MNNVLHYNGFIGTVNFSEDDGLFFGKIEGIDGLVNFEGKSVSELTQSFHEAVEDYIEYCKENGLKPHKSYSGCLNVRISPETHSQIALLSKISGITINAFIKKALEKEVKHCSIQYK